jgi:bacillithiol synthase
MMEIRPQRLEGEALVKDYLRGGEASSYYAGDPRAPHTFLRHAESVTERFDTAARRRAAACLRATSPEGERRLAKWVANGGMVVTTGQQAGLFGGPLYTVYKALTAARFAAEFERLLGVPVLPVFWIASEDHDWEEVGATLLPELSAGELRRVEVARPAQHAAPIAELHLGADLERALEAAAELLVNEPFGAPVIKLLRESYVPGALMHEAFADLLAPLLAPFGVFLADAAAPALKAASVGVLRRALEDDAGERAVADTTGRLEAAGWHPQVALVPGAPLLFHHGDAGRERLRRTPRGLRTEGGRERPLAQLLDELEAAPGRFSPNVHLRPVVESAVFPVLCYVGGPAELAYFGQVGELFRSHGMAPPPVLPRASFLLVADEARRRLERLGLDADELGRPEAEIAQRLLRGRLPAGAAEALARLRTDAVDGFRELIEAGRAEPPLRLALGAQRNAALAAIDRAERKLLRELRRRELPLLDDLRGARILLRPGGAPQDRIHGILPYLAREGEALLARLLERVEPPLAARVPA